MRRRHRLLVAAGLLAPACSPSPTPTAHRGRDQASAAPLADGSGAAPTSAPTTSAGEGAAQPSSAGPTTTLLVTTTSPIVLTPATIVMPLPEDEPDKTDEEWWAAQPGHEAPTASRDALLACIRSYESGGDYGAVSPSGQYGGAYQFDRPTWASVGGSGNPADASPAEQDARAWALYASRGLSPWPTPNRRCS